jgi:hypothetical protein
MGRPKGSKNKTISKPRIVAAVNFHTLEFIGIYNNPSHASKVLFDHPTYNTRIRKCADNEITKVNNIIFVWVNDENGFTTETIKDVIQKAKQQKVSKPRSLTFTLKIMNKMEHEEIKLLNNLYNKYVT